MIAESDVAVMPYNTRRKILSLPSLGIRIPVAHNSKATSRLSPPASTLSTKLPLRKQKRTHTTSPSPSPPSKRVSFKYENTPPPSPPASDTHNCSVINDVSQIDLENINDEIVEAVISQLHKTGNRPHLVKELATILRQTVKTVEQSANPAAIISSRLSSYIKRAWSENVPCPLTKELETAHPRRTHYYLTKYPCPPKLDTSSRIAVPPEIISPSTSRISSQSDIIDAERRRELSPSPEVDLSSPEYEDENTKSPRPPSLVAFPKSRDPLQNQRFTSPPLEKDEKEFTQTARGMQRRRPGDVVMDGMPSELGEYTSKSSECDPLFGRQYLLPLGLVYTSSPVTKPSALNWWRNVEESCEMWGRIDATWDTRSPENIELEELDGMLEEL